MKRITLTFLFAIGLTLSAPVAAQPAAMAAPTPEAMAAPAPTAPAPVASMDAPAAPAPEAVTTPEPAMTAAPVAPAPAVTPAAPVVKEPTPEWKTAGFWISKVVVPILLFVLGLLMTLGVIKKSWAQWARDKGIITVADKVVTGFLSYAEGTPAKWDDILAQALKAVVTRFGELAPEEKAKVEAVVKERKEQAEKKNGDGA